MALYRAFKAFRPEKSKQALIPALPYDVMNSDEAREMVKGNPYSFLHIDKAEIDLPKGTDIYSDEVYKKAKENLDNLEKTGALIQDKKPCFYIYRQIMNGRSQTGIVGCASIDDYMNNVIKKHEHTLAIKEQDRIRHVDTCNANTGPIFLTYRKNDVISNAVNDWVNSHEAVYDFVADGVTQTVWAIDDDDIINTVSNEFAKIDALYIADGHHRCASAVKVGQKRREEKPDYTGDEEFNFFLSVAFPDDELEIMDYNRVVKDLNGMSREEFLDAVSNSFEAEKVDTQYKPTKRHTFGMLIENDWYKLTAKDSIIDESDPVKRLDVSILQDNLLSPILDIDDPKTNDRIDFIGGIRGLDELERRCKDDMKLAFAMYPTSIDDLMSIADANLIMPPKSTWFEPKLLSGIFIHHLS
ncbi:MAG: DUF1015 family protein [Eubacteriales bacterium]|nr:DUF1015 family protein [Eubacteriales bacterium]